MMVEKRIFKKNEIICHKDENDQTLFYLIQGKALVFGIEGTQVTPFAYINKDEFIGELAFFDNDKRSAYVMAIEECELYVIPTGLQKEMMPDWLIRMSKNLAHRIRVIDNVIAKHGIKRKKSDTMKALSIDEQRSILQTLNLL